MGKIKGENRRVHNDMRGEFCLTVGDFFAARIVRRAAITEIKRVGRRAQPGVVGDGAPDLNRQMARKLTRIGFLSLHVPW